MEYIPDKKLYSAVMFALKMCPELMGARDKKIRIAADYYHVEYEDVLKIVRRELWDRARKEAKQKGNHWLSILNHEARDLLDTGWGNDFVLICPHCGRHFACNVNNLYKVDTLFVSQCQCGFADRYQRKIRKEIFDYISKTKGAK